MKILAATGIDLLTDADLLKRVRAAFKKDTKGKPYISPLKGRPKRKK